MSVDETAKAILKWQGEDVSCEYETGAMLPSLDLQAMARLWLLKQRIEISLGRCIDSEPCEWDHNKNCQEHCETFNDDGTCENQMRAELLAVIEDIKLHEIDANPRGIIHST